MPMTALDPVPLTPPPVKVLLAELVGARPGDAVAVRPTLGAAAALAVRGGATPSVLALDRTPWTDLTGRRIALAATLAGTVARVADALAQQPTALLAVPGVHPLTGDVLPLAELADLAHTAGAAVAVDGSCLVAAGRVDLAATDVDYVVFTGLDVHAPLAAGVLVGRAGGIPVPQPALGRAADGALSAACREVASLPTAALAAHENALRAGVLDQLRGLPGVRVVPSWPDATQQVGLVAFAIEGRAATDLVKALSTRFGLPGVDALTAAPVVGAGAGTGEPVALVRIRLDATWAEDDVVRLRDALEDLLTAS